MHCGDSYFHRNELLTPPSPPIGVKAFQLLVELDHKSRVSNQDRLRQLAAGPGAAGGEVSIFSAHDEFERLAQAG